MALINCPECGASISDTAANCPQCGFRIAASAAPVVPAPVAPVAPAAPSGNVPPCPESHLAKAIVVTLLCCWPLGIPAIVNAAGVSNAYISGNYALAQEKSEKANKWFKICLFSGIAFWILYIIFIIIYVVFIVALTNNF